MCGALCEYKGPGLCLYSLGLYSLAGNIAQSDPYRGNTKDQASLPKVGDMYFWLFAEGDNNDFMIFMMLIHFTYLLQKRCGFCFSHKKCFLECEKTTLFHVFLIGMFIPRSHPFVRSFLSLPRTTKKHVPYLTFP